MFTDDLLDKTLNPFCTCFSSRNLTPYLPPKSIELFIENKFVCLFVFSFLFFLKKTPCVVLAILKLST